MNQNYKSLYNRALGAWVAAPENARRAGKKSKAHVETKRSPWATLARLLVLSPALLGGGLALAAPVMNNGTGTNSLTISPNTIHTAQANGRNDIAIGNYSEADSGTNSPYSAIAIGEKSKSLSKETIALGHMAQANESQGIAIGAVAMAQGDQSTALGNNVVAQGNSSVAIGGDDLDTVSKSSTPGAGLNTSTTATTYKDLTGDILVGSGVQQYRATTTGDAAVAVGVQSQATGALSTAFGTKTTASGLAATALGVGANASKANAVALGSGSTTGTDATSVKTATIAGITYGSDTDPSKAFAGSVKRGTVTDNVAPGDQVSVGSAGYERQIKHVAPGEISKTSTDAINGSQLYAVAEKAQHHYYSVNDNGNHQSNYDNTGATGVNALAAGVGTKASADAGTAVGAFAEVQGKYGVAIGGGDSASVRTVAKGANAVAVGYNANADAENAIAIGTAATVAAGTATADSGFVRGQGSVAIGAASAAKGTNATALGQKAEAFGQNSLAAGQDSHATGKSSVALGDGAKGSKDSATAVGVYANATGPGATALGASTQADQWGSTAVGRQAKATGSSALALGDEAQASAINALASGAKAKATGKNSVATGFNALASNDGAVAVGSNTQATNASTAMGDSSKATGLNSTALGWQANAAGRADVYIGKQAGFGTSNSGNFDNVGIGEGAARNAGSASQAVTNVVAIGTGAAEGIQESHNIAIGAYANGTGSGNAQVTTGNNIAIGQRAYAKGGNSIALGQRTKAEGSAALAFGVSASAGGANSLAAGQLADASGVGSVAIGGAAQTANAARASGTQAIAIGQKSNATGDQATAMGVNAQASGNAAVAVGKDNNVSGGGSGALGSGNTVAQNNSFVLGKDVTTSQANSVVLGNASTDRAATAETQATVNGITYSGFAGVGSAAKGVVSVGTSGGERQLINVAAGKIDATSTDAINGSQLYLTQQALGNVGSTTASVLGGNATMANDGKITMSNVGNTGKNTVHDAIEAVNNTAKAGWNLQVNNGSSENVKPNDTVKFKDGNNIAISNNGKEITIATKPDLNADSLTIKNGGPVLNSGGINMNSKKITNVQAGTANTDAVNVGQLNQAITNVNNNVAAAKTEVVGGTNIASIGQSTGGQNQTIYTINADGTTVSAGSNLVSVTPGAKNPTTNITDYRVDLSAGAKNSLSKADSSVQNVVSANPNLTASKDSSTGTVTLNFSANPNFTSVKTGNSTLNNDGLTITGGPSVTSTGINAGGKKITNVQAGTANTDAVNVAQLKAAQTHYYSVNDNGTQVNNYNNDGATGTNALAAGTKASAAGNGAVAVGHGATAMGERSQASGYQATAFSQSSVASGDNASAVGVNAVASGTNATTNGLNARAEGTNASATATNASASGTDARASAENALASGTNASATAANAVASGSNASATASGGVALGANASADRAAISGASTSATASAGANQVYANDNAEAADKSAILATVSGNQGAVSVGQAGQTRQIINLAAGSNDSDAVNVAQLKAVAKVARGSTTHVTNTTNVYQTTIVEDNTTVSAGQGIRINRSGKNYQVALADDVGVNSLRAGDTVVNANGLSIGGTNYVGPNGLNGGGRVIGGVAPGRIAPDSDEAVNGAQLARVYDDLEGKDAGIASAMATANLPQVYLPGKSMVSVGVANYAGQSALAVGLSALSDNGKWVIRGSVNANKKKVGVGAGVGYQW